VPVFTVEDKLNFGSGKEGNSDYPRAIIHLINKKCPENVDPIIRKATRFTIDD